MTFDEFCMTGQSDLLLLINRQEQRIAQLEEALRFSKNNLHGINLCSINSMSSRHEMRRLADEAINKINEVIGS